MKQSRISAHGKAKKRIGRPPTGMDPSVSIRVPKEVLERVMRWAKKHGYNRSTAINGLIERGLKSCGEG